MPQNADARLTDLEVRYTYLERLVGDLDHVVIELRTQVARLERQVTDLVRTARHGSDGDPGGGAAADEKPPHY